MTETIKQIEAASLCLSKCRDVGYGWTTLIPEIAGKEITSDGTDIRIEPIMVLMLGIDIQCARLHVETGFDNHSAAIHRELLIQIFDIDIVLFACWLD